MNSYSMTSDQGLDLLLNKLGIDFVSKSTGDDRVLVIAGQSIPLEQNIYLQIREFPEKWVHFQVVKHICYHITVTLAEKVNLENIRHILEKYGMDFIPVACPVEIGEIKKKDTCFQPIKRHCDCDTTLGIINRRGEILTKKEMKKIRKQHSPAEDKLTEMIERKKQELENAPETVQWFGFLRELLDHGDVWHAGLFIHWQSDPLVIKEIKKVKKDDITKELLLHLEQDVFYEFTKAYLHQ